MEKAGCGRICEGPPLCRTASGAAVIGKEPGGGSCLMNEYASDGSLAGLGAAG